MLHHAYSKGIVINTAASAIQLRVEQFLKMVQEKQGELEVYSAMLFYSLDNITHFIYGPAGAADALLGNKSHQTMLNDQRDSARRKLTWFSTHMRWYVRWLAKQTGMMETILLKAGLYPQNKPFVYTGIREHTLMSYYNYKLDPKDGTIIGRLKSFPDLDDLDIASECADHFLAGINTTSDTLVFLIWVLSRSENTSIQRRLIQELRTSSLDDIPSPKDLQAANIPFFDAVIQETLRLYAPLPASEPRVHTHDTVILFPLEQRFLASRIPFTETQISSPIQMIFNPSDG